jgi:hypothetical protein
LRAIFVLRSGGKRIGVGTVLIRSVGFCSFGFELLGLVLLAITFVDTVGEILNIFVTAFTGRALQLV